MFTKGGKLQAKRPFFTSQKAIFCKLKDGLLQSIAYQAVTQSS